jgi:hypothetical protein
VNKSPLSPLLKRGERKSTFCKKEISGFLLSGRKKRKAERKEDVDVMRKMQELLWAAVQWGLVLACFGVMIVQVPDLIRVLAEDKPIRQGTYDTDEKTDACIRVLWLASKQLQEGKKPDASLTCPEGGQPLKVIKVGVDVIVQVPNPEIYGFRDMRISKINPIPELIP